MITRHFENDIKKLRILIIVISILQIGYLIIMFTNPTLWGVLDLTYHVNWILWGLMLSLSGFCIWFNWTKMPIEKKKKTENTFLILLLGIIGLWIWLPNKTELKNLTDKLTEHEK